MTDHSPPDDPLAALRARIERTQDAIDRLAAETARARAGGGPTDAGGPPPAQDAAGEAQALATLLHTARGLIPEDLWRQISEVVRQLLVLLRAILDWWIDRLASDRPTTAPMVQDIPLR